MQARLKNTKQALMSAAIRLAAKGGMEAAKVRAITLEAGVTEAALYRHYRSKEELCWQAYKGIVDEMIQDKVHLVSSSAPFREKLSEWIRLTYAYFDRNPEAFTYVLLMPHVLPASEQRITFEQGRMLMEMTGGGMESGEMRSIVPELALSHFSGLMLNVPRLINEGTLEGPALRYVEEVASAVWRIFQPESKADGTPMTFAEGSNVE